MKSKKTLAVAVAALVFLSVIAPTLYLSGASEAQASLSLAPSVVSNSGLTAGSTFTLDLKVTSIQNLWAWGVDLAWDHTVLNHTGTVEGQFMKSAGSTAYISVPADNAAGKLQGLGASFLSNMSTSGTGVLATFTFKVLKTGTTPINIVFAECDDPNTHIEIQGNRGVELSNIIPVSINNATFTNVAAATPTPTVPPNPNAHGPIAKFTPVDGATFRLGSQIQLDASTSLSGYDTSGGSESCPITSYTWSVEFQNGTSYTSLTGQQTSFVASAEGTFKITLMVAASDPHPPSDSGFQPYDAETHTITVLSAPQDSKIDVYTAKGGVGSAVNSSGYGPLQTVQLYAAVTYHGSPIQYQSVVFTILGANRTAAPAVRQGVTNASGVAVSEFRLPDAGQMGIIGSWSVTATVNVTDVAVNDVTYFPLNYVGGVQNIQVPASVHRGEQLPIVLTLNTAECPTSWSSLRLTVFDSAGVPVGSHTVAAPTQPQSYTIVNAAITVPSYAFSGNATLVVCLLTNSSGQYTALSPQASKTFQILP